MSWIWYFSVSGYCEFTPFKNTAGKHRIEKVICLEIDTFISAGGLDLITTPKILIQVFFNYFITLINQIGIISNVCVHKSTVVV